MKFIAAQVTYLVQNKAARRNLRFLIKFLLLLLAMIVLYSVIFHWIMEWEGRGFSWITGFYWTLTVMSTLGFGDITFASDFGRLFSIVVLMTGIIFLLVMLPFTFIQFFYAPWLEAQARMLTPRELPEGTRNHVLIIGPDPSTLNLARKIEQYGHESVLVCADVQVAMDLHDQGYKVVIGDHDDAETYRRLRVDTAAMVVAMDNDMRNTNIAFTIREVNAATPIVSKVDQDEALDILGLAGSTYVFQFTQMLGKTLARRARGGNLQSGIIGRLDDLVVAEWPVMRSALEGSTLRQLGLRSATGVNVAGVWERGRFELPGPDTALSAGMVLVLAGTEAQIEVFRRYAGGNAPSQAPSLILGGGRVGRAAAKQLRSQGLGYRIVEKNPRHDDGEKWLIPGNAADLEILERAGIREAPTVFITTHTDDMNIYLTIYCRRLRPDIQIISRATLDRNIGVLHTAGADLVISYDSLVANTIINLLNPGKVLMLNEGLNIFRMPLPPQLAGQSLSASHIRADTGCNVVAVGDGQGLEINPDPDQPLRPGTELILIGNADSERRFMERFPPQRAG
ncbi:potassium channel family protein [Solidesulfovibrio sp.]